MLKKTLISSLVIGVLAVHAVSAGPILDDILNPMFVDQTTLLTPSGELFKVERTMKLMKDEPVGQTFITGPDTDRIVNIRTWIDPDADWQPGEGVELTLWDSPAKKVSLGHYTIWYEFRGFQFSRTEFEVNAKVEPNKTYYFEESYVGEGDGKLCRIGMRNGADSYKGGQGYLAGKEADFDMCFQTHVKRVPDRIGNLKKAFARFDLSRPEFAEAKAAADKEDFDTAEAKVVAYFESRQQPVPVIDPKDIPALNPESDTTDGDLALTNHMRSREMGEGYAGPDMNWRAEPVFDNDGRIADSYYNTALNRYGPRGPLVRAYISTGNHKYAKKLNDLLVDYYLDNPPPTVSNVTSGDGSDPVWATLDAGIRLGARFIAYSKIHTSPFFELDTRFAYLLDVANDADVLVKNGAGDGGNWSFTQNASMFTFAVDFPEYTNAATWRETASQRLAASIKNDILPDGVETEGAPGYQRFSYHPLRNLYTFTQERGLQTAFTTNLRSVVEKQAEYFMYLNPPNGITPFLGDWGQTDERDELTRESELYSRQDILYVGTQGKQGTKPKELSKIYPYFGAVMLRSDWGDKGQPFDQARYLFMHGVHYGPHGHADLNGVTVNAYGREIIADPGSYPNSYHSTYHSLMTIDGQDCVRSPEGYIKTWLTCPVADFVSSHVTCKSGDYTRDIFYVRSNEDEAGDYWVFRDLAEGTGTHLLEQRWHLTPGPAEADKETLTARTMFDDGGNLSVMQVDPSRLTLEQTETDTTNHREEKPVVLKMPTMIYKISAELPSSVDTVLFPYKGKQQPEVQLKKIEISKDGLTSAFKVVQGKVEDLFVFQESAAPRSLKPEKIAFNGERLFVRRIGGKLRSIVLVNGTEASVNGKKVITNAKPLGATAVTFGKDGSKAYTGMTRTEITQ